MTLTGTLDVTTGPDGVSFSFVIENAGDESVTLAFRNALAADFVVLDGDEERWRWSADKMFAQALTSEGLAPGESVTYDGVWKNPEPGEFVAVASLEAKNHDCEAGTEFSV